MSDYFKLLAFSSLFIFGSELARAEPTAKRINGETLIHINVENQKQDTQYNTQHTSKGSTKKRQLEHNIKQISKENRRLRQRLRRMEQATVQLQQAVISLESQLAEIHAKQPKSREFSCLLKANNRGIFLGKGDSRNEAETEARLSCEEKIGPFWCNKPVKCEQLEGR